MRIEKGFLRVSVKPFRDHQGVKVEWQTLINEMGIMPSVVKSVVIRDSDQKVYIGDQGKFVKQNTPYIFSPNRQNVYRSFRMSYEGKTRHCVAQIRDGDIFYCRMIQESPDLDWAVDYMRPYNPDNIDDMILSSLNELGIRRVIGRELAKEKLPKDFRNRENANAEFANRGGLPTISIPYGSDKMSMWKRENRICFWSNEILTKETVGKRKVVQLTPNKMSWLLVMNGDHYDLVVWDFYFVKTELMGLLSTIQCRKAMYGAIGYAPDSFAILNYPVYNLDCFRYPDRGHDRVPKTSFSETWKDKYLPRKEEKK